MHREIFLSEARLYMGKWWFYLLLLLFAALGIMVSLKGKFSFPGVYQNSPYTISYFIGLVSLINIFTITLFAARILLREKDHSFDTILYATPIHKRSFLLSRFFLIFLLAAICFLMVVFGMAASYTFLSGTAETILPLNPIHYFYPYLLLVLPNALFCTAIVCFIGWISQQKLLIYLSGLFIYIFYILVSLFSNSPLLANASPVSDETISLMAKLDPFGMAAFFEQTKGWTATLRNTRSLSLEGNFLFNRVLVLIFSIVLTATGIAFYQFKPKAIRIRKTMGEELPSSYDSHSYKPVKGKLGALLYDLQTIRSFLQLELILISKSISFILVIIGWMFFLSIEIFSDIDAGIRLPQRYASSGLIANNIIGSFPIFMLALLLFYSVEMIWRSRNARIDSIENSSPVDNKFILIGKWIALTLIPFALLLAAIFLGLVFQLLYNYPLIDWDVYASLFYLLGVPVILSAGIVVMIQATVNNKYLGLILAAIFLLLANSFVGPMIGLQHPLLRFAKLFSGRYTDMNGFGEYSQAFGMRMLYWCAFTICLFLLAFKSKQKSFLAIMSLSILLLFTSGWKIYRETTLRSPLEKANWQQNYEERYRHYQSIPQPTITRVNTRIHLYPEKNSYTLTANYTLVNKQEYALDSFLLYGNPAVRLSALNIENARLHHTDSAYGHWSYRLLKPLAPGDSISMRFSIDYSWSPFNNHDPMNAIVGNGSFMRISRYFPVLGYQSTNEIEDVATRKTRGMPEATALTKLEVPLPKPYDYEFIHFDAVVSTSSSQTVIGTGELQRSWKDSGRNYFHYTSPDPIPFRFAFSSAVYAVSSSSQNGVRIEVYHHPTHHQNVAHLIEEARATIAYCEKNFGPYPFRSIRFAEVSGFTQGFAATAYPGTIFMTESMIFHADLRNDSNRDVINELAGHELSHLWWGNNQISPDQREGSIILTETLAMYTELMLYKQRHGLTAMKEVVKIHQSIYENGKQYSEEEPLYKASPANIYLAYNKGLVTMYKLFELIGEEKINSALKHFLRSHAYPNPPPTSLDLINAFLGVSDSSLHAAIRKLFMETTP